MWYDFAVAFNHSKRIVIESGTMWYDFAVAFHHSKRIVIERGIMWYDVAVAFTTLIERSTMWQLWY